MRHRVVGYYFVMCWAVWFASLLTAVLAVPESWAGEPPSAPILRIETGGHTSSINSITTDAQGRFLVTASDDRSCRVWDAATGKLLRTLRPPVGKDANEGKIFSAAISPDGEIVACGGWTEYGGEGGHSVFLFERASGRLLTRLSGFPNVVESLCFSPDGGLLATGGGDGGLWLWQAKGWSLVGKDKDYAGGVYGLAFDGRGRLGTAGDDGYLRLYSLDSGLQLQEKVKNQGAKTPFRLAFSPDGTRLAAGYSDTARVDLYSVPGLKPLKGPEMRGTSATLSQIVWFGDGRLAAAGQWNKQGRYQVRIWRDGGGGAYTDILLGNDTTGGLATLPGGGLAWASKEPSLGVLGADGKARFSLSPAIMDFRGGKWSLQVDSGARQVQFDSSAPGGKKRAFSVPKRAMSTGTVVPGLHKPITHASGMKLTGWDDTFKPELGGKALPIKDYEKSRSLAIAPDGKSFLLGSDWWLRLFDTSGKLLREMSIPDVAWGVNIDPTGKVAVATLGDGTVRWYRLSDLQEVLAFFPHADGRRWVLWTPSGYYDASPGGEDLIGWHVNHGLDQAADFFPAGRFRDQFRRPDVIDRILVDLDEAKAVAEADKAANRRARSTQITDKLPPVVTILSPAQGQSFKDRAVTVRYQVRSPGGEEVTGVRVLLDGTSAGEGSRGVAVQADGSRTMETTLTLPEHDVKLTVLAENKFGASAPAVVDLAWAGAKAAPQGPLGKLYVLAVGISQYKDQTLRLDFPSKDAKDFASAMLAQKSRLYADVQVKTLTDAQATKGDILDGLEWIQRQTTQHDMAMIFLAGHGVNDFNGDFNFLPVDADLDRMRATGLLFAEFTKTVANIPGKRVMFVDACHSGNILKEGRRATSDVNGIINELASAENGAVVFSSSTGRQYSLEDPAWNNGAFTKALVEGLSGKADEKGSGRVTHVSLSYYVSERVKELTKGRQSPVTQAPGGVPDFPLAAVK